MSEVINVKYPLTFFLFLMKTKVGIAVISYSDAISSHSSTSTLRKTTSGNSAASSC